MEVSPFISYATTAVLVEDITQVGEARRAAAELSRNLQLDSSTAGDAAIVVNELGTNLVKHAGGGQLLFNPIYHPAGSYLEIIALDKGPGMDDLTKCLEDGFSSSGTAGNGLGAVRRLAYAFDVFTAKGSGTVVLARMHHTSYEKPAKPALQVGSINLPLASEPISGDAWAIRFDDGHPSVMVADGLGHGAAAAIASRAAIEVFHKEGDTNPAATLQAAHRALKSTRGAAVSISRIDLSSRKITYCGLGNIAGSILAPDETSKSMVSHNGIVGHEGRRFTEFSYDWPAEALLVMHSDGLQSQWSLSKYPGIWRRDPALIAALMYRDFSRGRDDVSVVVIKE